MRGFDSGSGVASSGGYGIFLPGCEGNFRASQRTSIDADGA